MKFIKQEPKFKNLNLQNFPKRRKDKEKYKWLLIVITAIILGTFVWSLFTTSSSVFQYALPNILGNPLKSTDDRVNVLLLGNAGGMHDGPYLTDSIIVASYHLKANNVTLISIPRDLWVDSAKAKINALYALRQKNGNALKYTEDKIDDLIGIPIHYGVRLDFRGFEKAIDTVGGVEVDVSKTFDDYNYPLAGKENDLCGLVEKEVDLTADQIKALNVTEDKLNPILPQPSVFPQPSPSDPNAPRKFRVLIDPDNKIATEASAFKCRFEHIHFDQGKIVMDGATALKFVRSRMGTNGEGSDFARSKRQQLVIQSFREKALSLKTLTNPKTVVDLIGAMGESVETDIPIERFADFYGVSRKIKEVKNLVLGDLGKGKSVLYPPPSSDFGGAYVLIPPENDFSKIQNFIKQELKKQEEVAQKSRK
ncbi:LCP family protein [Candidatus Daviesbacteria bacterium]|nr:LCP family protein [Candidatus Daviesbacteria bacterium]